MISLFLILSLIFFSGAPLFSASQTPVTKGPLHITADETVSKEYGKIIEASGKVRIRYDLESGDVLESSSRFARYNEKEGTGELSGSPRAVWKSQNSNQPETLLTADHIFLEMKESELLARGNVHVFQGSTTLKTDVLSYKNNEKKMVALGGRPQFNIRDIQHLTEISAEEITAWSEKKEIQFKRKVRGVIQLLSVK